MGAEASPSSFPSRGGPAAVGKVVIVGCGLGCGFLVLAGLSFVIWLGIEMERGVAPDTAALPASKIPGRQLEELKEMAVVEPGEEVRYFYSAGFFSIRSDGNLFTDRRVISYEGDGGELAVYSATYDEIESIEFAPSDSWLDDSLITVYKDDGSSFVLLVSNEADRDQDFYDKLMREWNRARGEDSLLESPE